MSDMSNGKNKRTAFSAQERRQIAEDNSFRCHYCGDEGSRYGDASGESWHIDHKHPISKGGSNDRSNLTLACRSCNLAKSDIPYEDFILRVPDLAAAVRQELQNFQKLVLTPPLEGGTCELYQRTDDIDMDMWHLLATIEPRDRRVLVDLVRAVRRLYVLANRVEDA